MTFADKLAHAVRRKNSALVVGLDPRLDMLPTEILTAARKAFSDPREAAAEAFRIYQARVIERIQPFAVGVKPQIAFYERYGPPGLAAYEHAARQAREAGLLVIGDIKRGDIGSTAAAYAEAHLPLADAVTVSPYLGTDSLTPFLERAASHDCGLFVLVRTSNPSAAEIQDLEIDGVPVYERVASLVQRWGADEIGESGYSSVGAVVGATRPDLLARLRELMPRAWFLIPGIGAQGGQASEIGVVFDRAGLGAIVNSSRGILYAYADPSDPAWSDSVAVAAERLRDELRASALQAAS
jgi:orotidine-5'-phosphate decarboxylase